MAITYANAMNTVISKVENILEGEFGFPIRYDQHSGSESILLTPISDDFEDVMGNTQTRTITLELDYEMDQQDNYDHIFKRVERIKRLLVNNISADWFNGQVESIEFDENKKNATLTFTSQITEVLS